MTLSRRIATVTFAGADDSYEVRYEAWGSPGVTTDAVTYLDGDYDVQQDVGAPLPWSKAITSSLSIPAWGMNVQNMAHSGSISCRITVDGVVKDQETVDGFAAIAACSIPS